MPTPEFKRQAVTIAPNASLSDAMNLEGRTLVAVEIDETGWTTAAITFQASSDGTDFDPLYDSAGTEVTIASANVVAGRTINLDNTKFLGVQWIKVQSGTSTTAVVQSTTATRTMVLIAKDL
jgi:hypothetical protein